MIIRYTASQPGKLNPFLTNFLGRPASALPKGAQWAVFFHDLEDNILPAINAAYQGEPGHVWRTEEAARILLDSEYQAAHGCTFCQAISLPGEGSNPVPEGIKANAFIRSYLGAGRNDFPLMRMSFLETNVSFVDTFLRGWSLATAKYGMVARSGDKNYRTDASCYKFSSGPNGVYIRQKIEFQGLCCISVSEEEYNYDHVTSPMKRDAQFIYHSYSVNAIDGIDPIIVENQARDYR